MIMLDTHVVAWLYAGQQENLSKKVLQVLENQQLYVSPMVELELQYLHEIGRIRPLGKAIVEDLTHRIELQIATTPFERVVQCALILHWTRDPFDRLIVGNAEAEHANLLTADKIIRRHYRRAIW